MDDRDIVVADSEVQRCLEFLIEADTLNEDGTRRTREELAAVFGVSRQTLRNRETRWQETGVWDRAMRIYVVPRMNAMLQIQMEVLSEFPEVVRRQLEIAKHSPSDGAATRAADWLFNVFALPMMQRFSVAPSADEFSYVSVERSFNPVDILDED